MDFEIVKLYFVDQYVGWQTVEPKSKGRSYEEAYFIKIEGKYFWLGGDDDAFYVDEGEEA